MGKPVNSDVQRVETTSISQKVNKEVLDAFKDRCKYLGYPLNMLLETFMQQYADGRFDLDVEDVTQWKKNDSELDTLSTTFNKKIYTDFKAACKGNGCFVKHTLTAFMWKFVNENYVLEYVKAD